VHRVSLHAADFMNWRQFASHGAADRPQRVADLVGKIKVYRTTAAQKQQSASGSPNTATIVPKRRANCNFVIIQRGPTAHPNQIAADCSCWWLRIEGVDERTKIRASPDIFRDCEAAHTCSAHSGLTLGIRCANQETGQC
jgi:hypothetical protein